MRFLLETDEGPGMNRGLLTIGINSGSRAIPEAFFWEWVGSAINDGGPIRWINDGGSEFRLQLLKDGFRFGVLHNGGWSVTGSARTEPARPWLFPGGGERGIGERYVAEPPPQRWLTAFNWRLRAARP